MKTLLTFLCAFLLPLFLLAQTNPNHVYVSGYTRSDGTQVKGHYRTQANSTVNDNFSTVGNSNPYTGQAGWVPRDNGGTAKSSPSYNSSTYGLTTSTRSSTYNTTPRNESKTKLYSDGKEQFVVCYNCQVTAKSGVMYASARAGEGVKFTEGYYYGQLLNGSYEQENEDGIVIISASFKHGVLHGDYYTYDASGLSEEYRHYSMGVLDFSRCEVDGGLVVEIEGKAGTAGYTQSLLNAEGDLLMQVILARNGVAMTLIYFEGTSQVSQSYTGASMDQRDGPSKTYHRNGNLASHGEYKDSVKVGMWYFYNDEGGLISWESY
jgi:antitoxin component YwqK of YwqJK toxin-antitoxin module